MTLSEFLNGYYGFIENQEFEQRQSWERSRFLLSGLVSDPPKFPWDEGDDHKPYTDEEIQEIISFHEDVERRASKVEKLTEQGWVDVDSRPESTD